MGRKMTAASGRFASHGGMPAKQRIITKAPAGERRRALLTQAADAASKVTASLQQDKVTRLIKLLKRKAVPNSAATCTNATALLSEGRHDDAVALLQAALS